MEWVEPDWDPESEPNFQATFTALDLRKVGVIITPSTKAAEWARDHGYEVEVEFSEDANIYLIFPGDDGV